MKKKSFLKGVLFAMGFLAMLSGLFGCRHKEEPEVTPEKPDIEFGESGDDFSSAGKAAYRKVSHCEFYTGGMRIGFSYVIGKGDKKTSGYTMTVDDRGNGITDMTCELDEPIIEELSKLCADLNIVSWDGFNKTMKGVLDGSTFSLYLDFEDGTHVAARGSNSFPTNYSEFEKSFVEVLAPAVDAERSRIREEKYAHGDYSKTPEIAMINYSGRGASGSDSYSFLIRDGASQGTKLEINVTSVSGEFIAPGTYHYYGEADDTDKLLKKLQKVFENYNVYRWDGYDESTPDYNDREWFQLSISYPNAEISAMGCGDTENYAEVRKELLEILTEYMLPYVAN